MCIIKHIYNNTHITCMLYTETERKRGRKRERQRQRDRESVD